MFGKKYFRIKEIGIITDDYSPYIILKGSETSLFEKEKELVRQTLCWQKDARTWIQSLKMGKVNGETAFVTNLYRLSNVKAKHLKITGFHERRSAKDEPRHGTTKKNKTFFHETASMRFSDRSSLSRVLPYAGLMHMVACRGLGHEASISCDESEELDHLSAKDGRMDLYRYYLEKKAISFATIDDIRIKQGPEVCPDGKGYEKLSFECLGMIDPQFLIPDTILFRKGKKKVGFDFPLFKVTYDALKHHYAPANFENTRRFYGVKDIVFNSIENPDWIADSMTIVDHVMKRAKVKVDSIYIDTGNIKKQQRTDFKDGKDNYLVYNIRNAKVVLTKGKQKIATTAPGEYAMALSFLKSREILFKSDSTPAV